MTRQPISDDSDEITVDVDGRADPTAEVDE